ncbi:hypothetical protein CU097_007045 [Rhizopus azygosporus]|uniref:Homeobox domain-containing protein n=1 Tax=Rhizopus azygosporus TaxID=86630 RepID=A0A367JI11_RHIAZ|nr:hypothetical protein CU097_007045 [Rhizopus azygosporus]
MMPPISGSYISSTSSSNNSSNDGNVDYLNDLSQQFQYDMDTKRPSMINTMMPPPPPFVIPSLPFDGNIARPRKRTRTTPEQLAVLEKSFSMNPSPNSRVREQLSHQLGMPERSIQIWFQNRRAKMKSQAKRSMQMQDRTLYMQQQYAASAAAAACQSAAVQQQSGTIDPNLYNYYYYYYFQQIQQQYQLTKLSDSNNIMTAGISTNHSTTLQSTHSSAIPPYNMWVSNTPMPDLTLSASTSSSSTASDNHPGYKKSSISSTSERARAHSVGPYPYYHRSKSVQHERHASLGPPTSHQPSSFYEQSSFVPQGQFYSSIIMEEPTATSLTAGPVKQRFGLAAETLQIGTWKRVCSLSCQVDLSTRTLVWCIGDEQQQQSFRIDISFNIVQYIRMKENRLEFFVSSPAHVQFYMTTEVGKWIQCHDFTEDKQASLENLHILEGLNLRTEFMEVLMQAPELQSLLIQDNDDGMTSNLLLLQSLHLPS